MSNYIPSPEFEHQIRSAIEMPDASTEFVNKLRSRLMSQSKHQLGTRPHETRRYRWAFAMALFLLVVMATITLVIGPQRAWAAVRSLFGYLPGIGLVQNDAGLRILAVPVQMEREGIVVEVEEAATDGQRTIIVYKVEGLSLQAANSQGEGASTGALALLRMPDGSIFRQTSGDLYGWAIGYELRLIFPSLPADVNEFNLVIPRLETMPAGVAPEDWEIPLRFIPAPADLDIMPVYELGSIESSDQTDNTDTSPPEGTQFNETAEQGIQISLDRVVELEDGYLFQGGISWEGVEDVTHAWINAHLLTDANGQRIPVETVPPDEPGTQGTESQYLWAIRTDTKSHPSPWLLSVPDVIVNKNPDMSFQIDLGQSPQIGQIWDLNQELDVAGHQLRLINAHLYQDQDGKNWLEFTFQRPPEVHNLGVWDVNNMSTTGRGKGGPDDAGNLTSAFTYDQIPTGLRQITINGIEVIAQGSWEMTWQPPSNSEVSDPTETSRSQICLTPEKWQKLVEQSPIPLPDSITGKLLLMQPTGQLLPTIYLTGLDGSQRQDIAIGSWPSLSPDGSTLAFSNAEGLMLAHVDTGEIAHLSWTTEYDEYPVWSPDGDWIAFKRLTDDAIYRAHPDGSDMRMVVQSADIVNVSEWTRDGRLIYEAFAQDGIVIKAVRINTGVTEDLIQTKSRKPSSNYSISPDLQRIAYSDEVFGQSNGMYIHEFGDPEDKMIVAIDTMTTLVGAWSPDGEWLAVTVYEQPTLNSVIMTPVLIHPDTCQVIPLQGIQGEVVSWFAENVH